MSLSKILCLAEILNLVAVVTNQALANPVAYAGPPENPASGNILAHASNSRQWLLGASLVKIQRRLCRKNLEGKYTYAYERYYIEIPRKYQNQLKPLLNKELRMAS